ncbi:hypothetical protein THOM_1718 [Trachipleistophora hominis]|uniref:Uncharacterized protein n=1 Tax=Trachipleistophora hominis TaxID=72359 RepID=L7JX67_TRAHO|nr:hypothetical protein THOM_1718 [Trachipleistophora hominis]
MSIILGILAILSYNQVSSTVMIHTGNSFLANYNKSLANSNQNVCGDKSNNELNGEKPGECKYVRITVSTDMEQYIKGTELKQLRGSFGPLIRQPVLVNIDIKHRSAENRKKCILYYQLYITKLSLLEVQLNYNSWLLEQHSYYLRLIATLSELITLKLRKIALQLILLIKKLCKLVDLYIKRLSDEINDKRKHCIPCADDAPLVDKLVWLRLIKMGLELLEMSIINSDILGTKSNYSSSASYGKDHGSVFPKDYKYTPDKEVSQNLLSKDEKYTQTEGSEHAAEIDVYAAGNKLENCSDLVSSSCSQRNEFIQDNDRVSKSRANVGNDDACKANPIMNFNDTTNTSIEECVGGKYEMLRITLHITSKDQVYERTETFVGSKSLTNYFVHEGAIGKYEKCYESPRVTELVNEIKEAQRCCCSTNCCTKSSAESTAGDTKLEDEHILVDEQTKNKKGSTESRAKINSESVYQKGTKAGKVKKIIIVICILCLLIVVLAFLLTCIYRWKQIKELLD